MPHERLRRAQILKAEKNILIVTWGGIGDQICAEPVIRFAIDNFKKDGNRVSIATEIPELFYHLEPYELFDTKNGHRPIPDDYLIFNTIPQQNGMNILDQFLTHMHSHCVNYPAISVLGGELPISDRNVVLKPEMPGPGILHDIVNEKQKYVAIHAGRHWPSKTFPVQWWNKLIEMLVSEGLTPVLLGKQVAESEGYVETISDGCIDLRDKTTLSECIWLLQRMCVLLSNDSSPIHMAATGNAFIGLVASVKRPDFIMHYRWTGGLNCDDSWVIKGKHLEFAWRTKDFSKGGLWEKSSLCRNRYEDLNLDECDPNFIPSILPDQKLMVDYAKEKIKQYMQEASTDLIRLKGF